MWWCAEGASVAIGVLQSYSLSGGGNHQNNIVGRNAGKPNRELQACGIIVHLVRCGQCGKKVKEVSLEDMMPSTASSIFVLESHNAKS